MKKLLLAFGLLLTLAPAVFAQCYADGYGMMGYCGAGWGLGMLLYLVIAVFLIGSVFWLTYNLFSGNKSHNKRK